MADEKTSLIIGQARQCLGSASILLNNNDYPGAINRAYYCVFHCARALLLAEDTFDYRKHSQVIGDFRRKFIKTGVFEVRLSDIIGDLFDSRNGSDYDELYFVDHIKTEAKISDADYFYSKVCEHLGIVG